MSRVEPSREELEHRIKRMESKLKHSKARGGVGCLIYLVVGVVFVVGIATYILAASGFAHVPLVSKMLYTDPSPRYEVVIEEEVVPRDLFREVLRDAQKDFAAGEKMSVVTLPIDEEYLTYMVREELASRELSFEQLQASIDAGSIEIFMQRDKLFLTFQVEPYFDGKLKLRTHKVSVGQLTVPNFLGNTILSMMLGFMGAIENVSAPFGTIQDVRIQKGILEIDLLVSPNAKIFDFF
jgi:hypothetical protein